MALDRETVGLIFKLEADGKQAKAEMAAFQSFVAGLIEGIEAEFQEQTKKTEGHYRKRAEAAEGSSKRIKASNSVVKESIESISSEIIESFGIDGDVANMLANQMVSLKSRTVLASIGIAGAIAAIGAGFILAANQAAELGDQIHDLQKETGLTAETLSGLGTAAKLEGKSLNDIAGSVSGFSQKLIEARAGSKELQAAFRALGVDVKGDTDQALRQAIKRFSEFKDGAEKSALAAKVGIKDLLPILSDMEGGIDGAIKKAKELGLFFDEEGARAAANYKDQVRLLSIQFDSLAVSIGQSAIPVLSSLLGIIRDLVKDTRNLFNLKFQGSAFEAFLKDIPNLMSGLPGTNLMARFAQGAAAGVPPDGKGGGGENAPGFGKSAGTKRDEASIEALKRLQIQLAEEERLYREQAAALRRTFEQREIDEGDFVRQQIAALETRLAAETAILAKERAVVEKSRFSKEDKQTKLEEIATKEIDLARQTASEIERINDDSRKRLEQQGIQLAEAQVRTTEAMLARKAALVREAAEVGRITFEAAERELIEIDRQGIEGRLALANAELTRAGENTKAKEIAIERIKQLENELAKATEDSSARIRRAREADTEALQRYVEAAIRAAVELRQAREDQERSDPLSARSFFGDGFANALEQTGSKMKAFQGLFGEIGAKFGEQSKALGSIAGAAFEGIANGFTTMIDAFVSGAATGPAAMRQFAAGVIQAIAKMALTKAVFELAEGFAALARGFFGDPRGFAEATMHFKAAAIYGVVGAVAGLAGRALAPGGAGAGAGGGVGAGAGGGNEKRIIEQGDRRRLEPQIIIIRAETEPGVIVNRVIEDYKSNGPTRSVLRTDMLGASA